MFFLFIPRFFCFSFVVRCYISFLQVDRSISYILCFSTLFLPFFQNASRMRHLLRFHHSHISIYPHTPPMQRITTEHGWVYTDLGGLRGLNCSSWLIGWGCILGGLDGPRACLIYGWAGLDWVGAWVTSNKIDMIAIDVYVLTR